MTPDPTEEKTVKASTDKPGPNIVVKIVAANCSAPSIPSGVLQPGGASSALAAGAAPAPDPSSRPTKRIVTKEMLEQGFIVRWPSGNEKRYDFVVIRELPGELYEIHEPLVDQELELVAMSRPENRPTEGEACEY